MEEKTLKNSIVPALTLLSVWACTKGRDTLSYFISIGLKELTQGIYEIAQGIAGLYLMALGLIDICLCLLPILWLLLMLFTICMKINEPFTVRVIYRVRKFIFPKWSPPVVVMPDEYDSCAGESVNIDKNVIDTEFMP